MNVPFPSVKRIALVALLVASATGFAVASEGAPASHAYHICISCISHPWISANYTSSGLGYITGTAFTGGGTVLVNTYGPTGAFLTQVATTANSSGQISVYNFGYPPCQSSYSVSAYDGVSGKWSNAVAINYLDCLT